MPPSMQSKNDGNFDEIYNPPLSPKIGNGSPPTPTLLGHPAGLFGLFFTEMWERFSYYGMRALLVLYLTDLATFGMPRSAALELYGIYTALVYLTPLFGGYLADKYLGQRKAIFMGGLLMATGQFTLMSQDLLYYGLGLIIVGNGFFKPNISTMVGTLYDTKDPRRDGAYTIFYMGINIGAFLAPLICGYLGERYGYRWGFMTAGLGMLIGVMIFEACQGILEHAGLPPGRVKTSETGMAIDHDPLGDSPKSSKRLNALDYMQILGFALLSAALLISAVAAWPYIRGIWTPEWLIGVAPAVLAADAADATNPGVAAAAAAAKTAYGAKLWSYRLLLVLVMAGAAFARSNGKSKNPDENSAQPLTREEYQRIALIFIVAVFVTVFWAGFEQGGGTLNLFAKEKTQLNVFGFQIPATWFQAVNPFFIFALAPIFSVMWTALAKSSYQISAMTKQGLGLILLGCGFMLMYLASQQSANGQLVSPLWLIGVYFLHTVGELFLSPIGLSLVNRLAPLQLASLMMAVWFLANFFANYLAGIMESLVGEEFLWQFLVMLSVGSGVLMLLLTPLLKKIAHGRD